MVEEVPFGRPEPNGRPRFSRPMIVLVVEDEALVNMNVCDFLVDQEFTVFSARNAHEALSLMEELGGAVDLLFTDVNMPGELDGFDLVRLAHNRWPGVRILITTGGRDPSDLPPDLQKFGPMLPKPYRLEILGMMAARMIVAD